MTMTKFKMNVLTVIPCDEILMTGIQYARSTIDIEMKVKDDNDNWYFFRDNFSMSSDKFVSYWNINGSADSHIETQWELYKPQ